VTGTLPIGAGGRSIGNWIRKKVKTKERGKKLQNGECFADPKDAKGKKEEREKKIDGISYKRKQKVSSPAK